MRTSSRGMYCTGGYEASLKVSARVVSAMTWPAKRTRTLCPLGAIVMGWSGPGIFMRGLLDRWGWRFMRRGARGYSVRERIQTVCGQRFKVSVGRPKSLSISDFWALFLGEAEGGLVLVVTLVNRTS